MKTLRRPEIDRVVHSVARYPMSSLPACIAKAPQSTICDMASNIGKLTKVDLREIWKNEEYDFSSWLAQEQNIALLSEKIPLQANDLFAKRFVFILRMCQFLSLSVTN